MAIIIPVKYMILFICCLIADEGMTASSARLQKYKKDVASRNILPKIAIFVHQSTHINYSNMANNTELIAKCEERANRWLTPAFDNDTQKQVKEMLEAADKTELIESF